MLSDELDSKPEVICCYCRTKKEKNPPVSSPLLHCSVVSVQLLVQFVQNASIPLVQGLEDSDSKQPCLPLLAPADGSLCGPLELTGQRRCAKPALFLLCDGVLVL